MAKKRKYKPLTRKAKFRLALVIGAGILILALLIGVLVFAVQGIVGILSHGDENDDAIPVVSGQEELEPYATVILDPGHGGSDGGAVAMIDGVEIVEKDIDVAVTEMVKALLERQNIEVLLTRDEDVDMDLKERTKFANSTDADLFVSLHCNTSEDTSSANGLECYYEKQGNKGKELAENILNAASSTGKIVTRELRTEMMYVVRFSNMPAVLVEMGFMTNAEELEKLCRTSYQQILAGAVAEGILTTLDIEELHVQ
jgi:N-acetylmuramoyl-L-alanine amidase